MKQLAVFESDNLRMPILICPTPVDSSNKLVKIIEADEPFDQHIY